MKEVQVTMCLELRSLAAAYIQRAQVDITAVGCGESAEGRPGKESAVTIIRI